MDESRSKKGFGWSSLIVGILFFIASMVAFYNPGANLEALAIIFAILLIVNGAFNLAMGRGNILRIVVGILDILIGIFMLINFYRTMLALPYIFAIWFIVDSLFRLFTIGATRLVGTWYFWLSLILNILGIIVGIMLLFNPVLAAFSLSFLVGFYLMIVAIECIVMAFAK